MRLPKWWRWVVWVLVIMAAPLVEWWLRSQWLLQTEWVWQEQVPWWWLGRAVLFLIVSMIAPRVPRIVFYHVAGGLWWGGVVAVGQWLQWPHVWSAVNLVTEPCWLAMVAGLESWLVMRIRILLWNPIASGPTTINTPESS